MKKWSRQIHRWMSIAFTATVLLNIVVLGMAKPGTTPPVWVTYSPFLPLVVLLGTGLYMFVLPYAAKMRARRGANT